MFTENSIATTRGVMVINLWCLSWMHSTGRQQTAVTFSDSVNRTNYQAEKTDCQSLTYKTLLPISYDLRNNVEQNIILKHK